MRKQINPLHSNFLIDENYFSIPTCALEAIAYVFNIDPPDMLFIAKLARYNVKEGPTTLDCRRMIQILCVTKKKKFTYTHNRKKVELQEFVQNHRKGIYILNQEAHLNIVKNGIIIDSWNTECWDIDGWWEITDKYPKRNSYLSMAA